MKRSIYTYLLSAVALASAAQTPPAPEAAPVAGAVAPAAKPEEPAQSKLTFSGGADIRFRYDYKDNAPSSGGKINTAYQDYYRLRTRVWGEANYENVTLFTRLADEFRGYHNAPQQYQFPDEVYFDALYLDVKDLIDDRVDLRVGRQDMKFGDGRIISDGTAGDGSRSTYFDAVRATIHLSEKNTLDVFGIYQRPEDDWTLGNERYDLTSLTGGENNDLTESAAGLYLTLAENKEFPVELYYIWKDESRYFNKGDRKKRVPGRDFSTAGTRLTPSFNERLSAEIEGAAQFGQTDAGRDILAYLGYAGVLYKVAPDHAWKPTLKGGLLYLSGDENAKAGDDNNWNPVFNRTLWFSELASGQYSKYYWTNLLYPHLEVAAAPAKAQKVSLEAGPMFAAENDTAQDDSYRGLLGIAKYQFPLRKGFFRKESEVKGTVLAEVFDAGDYYADAETGYYLRFELSAKF
jgi:hypothetical protein